MTEKFESPPLTPIEEANAALEGTMFQAHPEGSVPPIAPPPEGAPSKPRRSIGNLGSTWGPEYWANGRPHPTPSAPAEQVEAPTPLPHANQEVALVAPADATEQAAEAQRDADARYTDIELLGKSFRVRRNIHENATRAVRRWDRIRLAVRNGAAAPGRRLKQRAQNRAQANYDSKVVSLEDTRVQSAQLLERRQGAVEQARARLDEKQTALANHNQARQDRIDAVHGRENQRQQRHAEYIGRKKEAVEHKLARQAVRDQLRGEGASRRETKDILAGVPKEHLERIGKVAIVAEATRVVRERAERVHSKAVNAQEKNRRRLEIAGEYVERHGRPAGHTAEIIDNLSSELSFTEDRINILQEKLSEDSADYPGISAELQDAQEKYAVLRKEYTAWQNVSARQNRKVRKGNVRADHLETDRGTHAITVQETAAQADLEAVSHVLDKTMVQGEVYKALNPDKKLREAE